MNRCSAIRLSYVVITHNLPVVRHVSDRLAIMYMGRFVEQGATSTIFARPAHPYTEALLTATPIPDPDRAGRRPRSRARCRACSIDPRAASSTPVPYAQERCRIERLLPQLRLIRPDRPLPLPRWRDPALSLACP